MGELVTSEPATLWEVHLRIPDRGPVALACKRGGERLTDDVLRLPTPADVLRRLEHLLERFAEGDQLFVTARTHDSALSMWRTNCKSAGLYWCASALAKLWRSDTCPHEYDEEKVPLVAKSSGQLELGRAPGARS
ncbi:MAG: hypothetical protein JWN48_1262 [Myxococcaceae bacterium]|nr:hypothetical protein [Myxococcaceae bacterium]